MTTTQAALPAAAPAQPEGSAESGPEELARAVDEAAAAVARLDGPSRQACQALRGALEAAHRAGLVTIVRRLRADDAGRALLYELVEDPTVRMLFSLHGIIRPDPLTAGRRALESVRPGLAAHGGDVELVGIEGDVGYVRLSGACNGCSMSSATMRATVEQALLAAVPGLDRVEVVPSEPAVTVIPLSEVGRRGEPEAQLRAAGWARAAAVDELPDGEVTQVRLTAGSGACTEAIVVRLGSSLAAYRDACAHQGLPLGEATLDPATGTLTCPWHGFCYDALSGECTSAVGATLEQLPLRLVGSEVWVRVDG